MRPTCRDDIVGLIERYNPRTLLAVGADASTILAPYVERQPGLAVERVSGADPLAALAPLARFDVALIAGVLEHLDKARGGALLARIRDVHAPRFIVAVPAGDRAESTTRWERNELYAYALEFVAEYTDEALHLYKFELATYKTTPDWFNPRYWAHPELWDKYRW